MKVVDLHTGFSQPLKQKFKKGFPQNFKTFIF